MTATPPISSLEVYPEIGRRIRAARTRRGMTQLELAANVELTRTSINNIEQGRQRIIVQTVYDIAEVLGVPAKDLLP